MKIFVDEAGSFKVEPKARWSIGCVGALVVPEGAVADLDVVIPRLKDRWRLAGEIKGRALDEEQASQLVTLLSGYDVIFTFQVVDMALEVASFIDQHRSCQASEMTRRIDDRFKATLIADLVALEQKILRLPDNLYVQATATWAVLWDALQLGTLHYVRRKPEELGSIAWVIDAKDRTKTWHEQLWQDLTLPALQATSFREPLITLRGADYSHFERYRETLPETPEHLLEPLGERGPTVYTSANKVFEDVTFANSEDAIGLQLADAVTSITRRAMQGNLGREGWQDLGRLMVRSPRRDKDAVEVSTFTPPGARIEPHRDAPYQAVIPYLNRAARSLVSR